MPEGTTDDAGHLCSALFVHNIALKLVSLLLAIGLWLVVARDPIAEVEIRVPIEFHNLPDNLEVDSASFTEAQIRVRGPERVIHPDEKSLQRYLRIPTLRPLRTLQRRS